MKHPSYGALHTPIQSDMAFFFLHMRLLASPFGLAKREANLHQYKIEKQAYQLAAKG